MILHALYIWHFKGLILPEQFEQNPGVVAIGKDIHQARDVVETLEEWAKILTIAEIFGGSKESLSYIDMWKDNWLNQGSKLYFLYYM